VQRSYFDHNATSPVAPEVLRTLTETLADVYGNPSSIHYFGQRARQQVEAARRSLAERLGCLPQEIVFTGGGTEADNLAIFGVARRHAEHFEPCCHMVTSAIEHPAVLAACERLERDGHPVTYLDPNPQGFVAPEAVRSALRPNTALVSIMHANNETGVVQPIREIADALRGAGVLLHVDGVQAAGKIPFSLRDLGADLYSVSGHKMGAPKGVGALFIRKSIVLDPILYGGRHERERRAGTENVPGIVALGCAAGLAYDAAEIAALRDRLEAGIRVRVPAVTVNGGNAPRLPNTTNIRFDGIEGEAMTIALDLRGFAVSSGSACSSGAVEPSHVLLAMGMTPDQARSSVRFSLGPGNTAEEVDGLIEAVVESAAHLRRISATFRPEEAVAHA
jgi:cysteine desulfurase